ncbi:hypothetical protein SDC9_193312 [bioreactor metagenome]|uniref:Uncharacterized protein n=1 Tax=bioreactor metagenome TaxID=1076179 RepID=A0A645I382_9ZZZZ
MIQHRVDRPRLLAGGGIKRDQPTVEGADIHLALPHRDTAVDRSAAAFARHGFGHLGIVFPQ